MAVNATMVDKVDSELGNTISSSRDGPKRKPQFRSWVFTHNNYEVSKLTEIRDLFLKYCIKGVYGREIAPTTGTPHLQGFIKFKNARMLNGVIKLTRELMPGAHWEVAKGDEGSNLIYCSKGEQVVKWGTWIELIKDPMEGLVFYDWQINLKEIIAKEPDSRTIHWFWEPEGNMGKTTFAKHLCIKNPDAIYVNGKAADIKLAIRKMAMPPRVVLFGIPRNAQDYVSYSALEEVKDGINFVGKGCDGIGMNLYNPPHVVVFSNQPPDESKLSKDRWNVVRIFNIPKKKGIKRERSLYSDEVEELADQLYEMPEGDLE